jgi:hypothetical protein
LRGKRCHGDLSACRKCILEPFRKKSSLVAVMEKWITPPTKRKETDSLYERPRRLPPAVLTG